MPETYPFGV